MVISTPSAASVPRIIVGTESIGSVLPDALVTRREREAWLRYLDGVVDAGCTAFDLAASYQLGGTERLFGHWLETRRHRDRLFLIGKGGHPYPILKPNRLSAEDLASDLHASLRRLRIGRLDLYMLHRDHPHANITTLAETLVGFERQGKIAAIGVSNWQHRRVEELVTALATHGATLAAVSPQFSLAAWTHPPWPGCVSIAGPAGAAARTYYTRAQLPVFAWSPLSRGYFANGGHEPAIYATAANAARRSRAQALAKREACTPTQLALAYVLGQNFPARAIVASRSVDNMKQNLHAPSVSLSAADIGWLENGEAHEARA